MGQTLSRSGLFPPLLIEMIKVGERSGELERMLERVADNYEREVESSLRQMTTIIQPRDDARDGRDDCVYDAGGVDADLPAQPDDAVMLTLDDFSGKDKSDA